MEALQVFLSGSDAFCSVCLAGATEGRLVRGSDAEFFAAVQVNQMTPYICAWCFRRLRHYHELKNKALRAQYWLYNLHHAGTYGVESATANLGELDDIKSTHLTVSAQPVTFVPACDVSDVTDRDEDNFKIKEESQQIIQVDIDTGFDWHGEGPLDPDDTTSGLHMLAEASSIQNMVQSKSKRPCEKMSGNKKYKPRKSRNGENLRRAGKISETDTKVVLDELDDVGYMLSELMAERIQATMLSDEQYWTLHAEKLNKPQYTNLPYKCSKCAVAFHQKDAYSAHMDKHKPSPGHTVHCTLCDTHYRTPTDLSVHQSTHLRRYRCTVCGHQSYNRQDCMNHYFSQHTRVEFHCRYCDVKTKGPFLVKEHIHSKHKIRPKDSEQCGICKKMISQRNKYRHAQSHEIHAPLRCEHCGNTLKNEWSLRHHIKKFHSGKLDLLEECTICKKSVPSSGLSAHIKKHTNSEICPHCFKAFNHKSALKVHVKRMHTEKLRFECADCFKFYTNKASIRRHIMFVHMKMGGVECAQCGQAFSHVGELNCHVRKVHEKHTLPRDKLCDICGKGFTTRKILENHRMIHTGEKPHTCPECGQHFRQSSAMRTHIKLKHLKMKMRDIVGARRQRPRPEESEKLVINTFRYL